MALLVLTATAPAAGATTLDGPRRAGVDRPVALTLTLPARVAAVEGRVLVADGAAEIVGAAPAAGGRAYRPVDVQGGAVFGAFDLRPRDGRVVLRLVVEPRRTGRVQLRVIVDAAADARGRRLRGVAATRTIVLQVGGGSGLSRAPAGGPRSRPAGRAHPAGDVVRDGDVDRRDVELVRAGWEDTRWLGGTCRPAPADANGDGCVDIVDVQAELAAHRASPDGPRALLAAGLTFTVTSTLDDPDAAPGDGVCATGTGACTLRAAMSEADWLPGDDRIEFALSGAAPVTIPVTTPLPYVTSTAGTLTIDGYTQPGSSVNTAVVGSNAVAGVELRGPGAAVQQPLLRITSGGNTVRGLLINAAWRAIFLDTPAATGNRIVGNIIGYARDGTPWPGTQGQFGVLVNVGANHTVIGTPDLADRNLIGNVKHAIEHYGPGTNANTIQNNVLCLTASGLGQARCDIGVDHNFGPKGNLIGGFGPNERNVVGPTWNQAIELSHGWNPALQPRQDSSLTYQVNDHRVLGNWLGFKGDGHYDPDFRSGVGPQGTADNGNGVNVIDGASHNLVEGNVIASVYDGVQVMGPTTTDNVVRGNLIGVSPLGEPAPLTGWGVKVRWSTKVATIDANVIRNAALGGIGLVENTVFNIRLTGNVVSGSNGPGIDLYGVPGADPNDDGDADQGANTLFNTPIVTAATGSAVSGTGAAGATVEVYRASRPAGQRGLPTELLGSATVAANGTWTVPVSLNGGTRVTALQIRQDDSTSELAPNVAVQAGGVTTYVDDAFSRTVGSAWGAAPLGGPWTTIGTAAAFTVDGASGNLSMAANANRAAVLTNVSERDVDLVADLTTDRAAVNGRHYVYALVRRINDTNEYRAKIRFGPGTALFVQTVRLVNNAETAVGPEVQVPGLAYTPGTPLRLRVQASGASPTTLRMRVWPASGGEPSVWHWTGTDASAALQAAGGVGIRSYLDGGVTNGPIRLSLDALRVTSIAASGPNTAPVVDAVSVTPASATTASTLTAAVTAHDAEGDALLTAYQWTRNGADLAGATSASLSLGTPGAGDRGDSIAVRVTVSDGQAVSPSATSSPVVVGDSPSVATVTLSPPSPLVSATLTATAGVTDADGDAVSLRYTWALNGVVASSGTATTFSFAGVAQPGDVASVLVEPRFADDTPSGPAVSAQVTYASATPPPTTYVDDPFARTLAGAWGSAPTGGAWTLSGTAADFAVSAGAGTISMAAGANRAAVLPVSVRDVDLRLDLSTDRLSVGGLHFVYALVRRVNTTNEYRAKVRLGPGGAVFVQVNRLVGNVESAVGPEVQVPGLTFSPGLVLHLRTQAEGASPTALRMRLWAGATEPSTWQWTGTDSSAALQAPGALGVRSYLDATVTNGRVALRIDDVRATSIPLP